MVVTAACVLLLCSIARHVLLQSGAFDLGIFDQAIYLISQGQPPISSYLDFHILGDHAAFILYAIALLYWIYPSVYWLFLIQAISLGGGAYCTWILSRQAHLSETDAVIVSVIYLLYPVIFNVNLFDFHPEVLAVPALFMAVWAARARRKIPFLGSLIVILGCKAVLALVVVGMGIWLVWIEKRRSYGILSICLGISWFIVATQLIFPIFKGGEHAALSRYSYLGDSVLEVIVNLLIQPQILLGRIFSWDSLVYLILLLAPVIWGLSLRGLVCVLPTVPILVINILSDSALQRDLIHQYSLPVVPFLILALIHSVRSQKHWIQIRRYVLIWSVIAFLALAKFGLFWTRYLSFTSNWTATRIAISEVSSQGSVLTNENIAAHLSHRPMVKLIFQVNDPAAIDQFHEVLINSQHPGWGTSAEAQDQLLEYLKGSDRFRLHSWRDGVYLFKHDSHSPDPNASTVRSQWERQSDTRYLP